MKKCAFCGKPATKSIPSLKIDGKLYPEREACDACSDKWTKAFVTGAEIPVPREA